MTTIYPLDTGHYYQLPHKSGGAVKAPLATISIPSDIPAISNSGDAAYLLDLSPEAKNYLENPSSAAFSSLSNQFLLNKEQQDKIHSILMQYKEAPYTQETFNQIQDDLHNAGLSPDQLAREDKVKSFNGTQLLLDYLNGRDPSSPSTDNANQAAKQANFMQRILSDWQNIRV